LKILLLDIETAPAIAAVWSLRADYVPLERLIADPYTLCFAAKWLGEREMQFHAGWKGGHARMVREAHKLLGEADAVAHYNGTKFDIPVLRWEFMAAHLGPPSPFKQIDLYRTMRTAAPLSRKLDFVVQRLGLGAKTKHKGMELWRACMDGDKAAHKVMERYNRQDVNLLEKLYRELLPWIPQHPNLAMEAGHCCPKCGSDKLQARGFLQSMTRRYRRWQCRACGAWSQSVVSEPGGAKLKAVA
jgi:hypothetical protein